MTAVLSGWLIAFTMSLGFIVTSGNLLVGIFLFLVFGLGALIGREDTLQRFPKRGAKGRFVSRRRAN